jgi:hypothetical protein
MISISFSSLRKADAGRKDEVYELSVQRDRKTSARVDGKRYKKQDERQWTKSTHEYSHFSHLFTTINESRVIDEHIDLLELWREYIE